METDNRTYVAIDLKSFYASVECADRGLDPLKTNLVVADRTRTEKTICLAVSPSLKAYGIGGRPRLFEVTREMKRINAERLRKAPGHRFRERSYDDDALKADPSLELTCIIARPRMAYYIRTSARIYQIYLRYIAPEDIHVYSIDEVFMDVTAYLNTYHMSAQELAVRMIREVLAETGITATAGIGTNLYLAKIAMDIIAKHAQPDRDGVRIASLDEEGYRRQLWDHRPLTDFWRIGEGYASRLEAAGLLTMGDVAAQSLADEDILYDLFGVNAELLIDHAWGYEPCTMAAIKAYQPKDRSLSSGQVLMRPYRFEEASVVVREMAYQLVLDMAEKQLTAGCITLTIGYDSSSASGYQGETHADWYGRQVPRHAQGTVTFPKPTGATKAITDAAMSIFSRRVDRRLTIRRINITAGMVMPETAAAAITGAEQLDLFGAPAPSRQEIEKQATEEARDRQLQKAVLGIRKRYGKNAVIRGLDMEEAATGRERNKQIGGHKA